MNIRLELIAGIFLCGAICSTASAAMTRSTLMKMMSSQESLACSMPEGSSGSKGTFYIAKGKMRGEFEMPSAHGSASSMHSLSDGKWAYNWGGPYGENQGTKVNLAAIEKSKNSSPKKEMDYDREMAFDCKPWKYDASMFQLPAGVTFADNTQKLKDMQSMLKGSPHSTGPGAAKVNCGLCDQAPDKETREKCRAALGC